MISTDNIWYLAYGSNLSSKVFEGRRKVRPIEQRPVFVPGFELVFNLEGLPFLEPAFANIRRKQSINGSHDDDKRSRMNTSSGSGIPELIGVAYLITPEDYRQVFRTEGGGSSYQEITVECEVIPLDEDKISSKIERITAHTLLAPPRTGRIHYTPLQPSKRYINIIRAGAREHNLPASYIAFLDSITPYQRSSTRQHLGAIVFLFTWLPLVLSIFTLGRFFSNERGHLPYWLLTWQRFIFRGIWTSYDYVFKPIFGNGEGLSHLTTNENLRSAPEKGSI